MLTNFHTHTTFCDGKNTAEEMVLCAIEKGFCAIGFSGHGYTGFDTSYCLQNPAEYRAEINRLKEKYGDKIEIYLGVEEDSADLQKRADYDYIIGSSHYLCVAGKYYPVDSSHDGFKECLELFSGDEAALAECYYGNFCDYILKRKPDIIGHFDLITKYDELDAPRFLNNEKYFKVAEKYLLEATRANSLFEVNTGAVARGLRSTPYPSERLLHLLKKNGGNVILSSDAHSAQSLDFYFEEARALLKNVGFEYVYTLSGGKFKKDYLA